MSTSDQPLRALHQSEFCMRNQQVWSRLGRFITTGESDLLAVPVISMVHVAQDILEVRHLKTLEILKSQKLLSQTHEP